MKFQMIHLVHSSFPITIKQELHMEQSHLLGIAILLPKLRHMLKNSKQWIVGSSMQPWMELEKICTMQKIAMVVMLRK